MKTKERVLIFIASYIEEHGYAPSYAEIAEGVGLKSKSSVHGHVKQLMEDGVLETDAPLCSPRALRIASCAFC